jgi:hypothetical protein
MLPDFDRADRIGSYWGNPKTRTFAELLIDCEEDRTLRAVLVGMLREADPAQIQMAAHSDCGKPMVAVGHGGGPPEHALEHMAAGKAHAGGTAEDEGSGTPGS